jgi:hypothetical protein
VLKSSKELIMLGCSRRRLSRDLSYIEDEEEGLKVKVIGLVADDVVRILVKESE